MLSVNLTPLADLCAWMILCLCRHVADQGARRRIDGELSNAIWRRLNTLGRRFASLVARVQAGKLRPLGVPGGAWPQRPPGTPHTPSLLPRNFGWLRRVLPESSSHGGIEGLLRSPEMAALIAAAPVQAGRILRPLCHMLGTELAPGTLELATWPPPVVRRPRPARPPPAPPPPSDPVAAYYSRPGGLVLNPHYPHDGRSRLVWS